MTFILGEAGRAILSSKNLVEDLLAGPSGAFFSFLAGAGFFFGATFAFLSGVDPPGGRVLAVDESVGCCACKYMAALKRGAAARRVSQHFMIHLKAILDRLILRPVCYLS
jgi:hypothetical protein